MEDNLQIDTCNICFEENEEIHKDCCGIKMCIGCWCRYAGNCTVCEKKNLRSICICNGCLNKVPMIFTGICDTCEEIFCERCLYRFNPPTSVCFKEECIEEYEKGFREWSSEKLLKKISSKLIQKKWKEYKNVI